MKRRSFLKGFAIGVGALFGPKAASAGDGGARVFGKETPPESKAKLPDDECYRVGEYRYWIEQSDVTGRWLLMRDGGVVADFDEQKDAELAWVTFEEREAKLTVFSQISVFTAEGCFETTTTGVVYPIALPSGKTYWRLPRARPGWIRAIEVKPCGDAFWFTAVDSERPIVPLEPTSETPRPD